jgi:hypothetical protein
VGVSSSTNTGYFLPLVVPVGVTEEEWPVVITTYRLCYDPGRFTTQSLAAYSRELRALRKSSLIDVANKLGVFFPNFQCEAMWISFSAPAGTEYKVRVFVGGINIVAWKKWDERNSKCDSAQNYVVVPPQEHLDGISVDDVIIEQFVAMSIGNGYSIVKQSQGRKDMGGLQIEVTPRITDMDLRGGCTQIYPETKDGEGAVAPRSYGLSPGLEIRLIRYGKNDGSILLCGIQRRHQKRTLGQLIDLHVEWSIVIKEAITTAPHKIKMQIKLPRMLRAHKIETLKFSPLTTMSDVALNTTYHEATLKVYAFCYEDRSISSNNTIAQAGLTPSSLLVAKPKRAPATALHGARPIMQASALGDASEISFNSHGRGGYGRGDYGTRLATTNSHMPQIHLALQPPLDPNNLKRTKNLGLWVSPPVTSSTQIFTAPFPLTTGSRHLSQPSFLTRSSTKRSQGWCVFGRPSRRRRILRKGCRGSIRTMAPHLRL